MWESFAQVTGDDALHPLVDLYYALPGTSAHRHTDRKAKKHSGKQTKRERPTNDACDLPDFIDISSNHQHVAVRQTSRDQADGLFLWTSFVDAIDVSALYNVTDLEIVRQAFQVTRD